MTLDASNVRVGVTGAVYVAPAGTALPTDALAALDGSFVDLGFVDEEGVTETQDRSIENIKAWQRGAVVRKVSTEHDLMYKFKMLETNDDTLAVYYGDDVSDGAVEVTGGDLPRQVWVIDVVDGPDVVRICVPDGQVTEQEDVTYANGEAIGRGVTVSAYPDTTGVKAYMYFDQDDLS